MLIKYSFYFLAVAFTLTCSPWIYGQGSCFECHDDPDLTAVVSDTLEISAYVDSLIFASSSHGEFECVDCHVDAEGDPHDEVLGTVDCSACHDDVMEVYHASVHGDASGPDAASCADCHGKHDILSASDAHSKVYPLNLASTCAICHADPKIVKKYHIPIHDPLAAYRNSVHGIALMSEENFDAATCTSCHGNHGIYSMKDPESPIYWKNVPETCGQCHGEIYEQFTESVHGVAVEEGLRDAPVCTDCHGEHGVKSPEDPESRVHPLRVSAATCERCHASEIITERYGIAESRVITFEESYHGLAIKGGSMEAANCASCHGIHNIFRSSDPRSLVHVANLHKTCGNCHPGIDKNVSRGAVHLTSSTTPGRVVKYVKDIYILLIVVVIGGMALHNGADFIRKSRRIVKKREAGA